MLPDRHWQLMAVGEYGKCGPTFPNKLRTNQPLTTADILPLRNASVHQTLNSNATDFFYNE